MGVDSSSLGSIIHFFDKLKHFHCNNLRYCHILNQYRSPDSAALYGPTTDKINDK